MIENKIKTATGLCIVNLTQSIMKNYAINESQAYEKLISTDFFTMLNDPESNLFLESDSFLTTALNYELNGKKEKMIEYITTDI